MGISDFLYARTIDKALRIKHMGILDFTVARRKFACQIL
jgi:hypothetical protein